MILFVIILLLEENFYMTSKNFSLFLKKGVGISFEKTLEGHTNHPLKKLLTRKVPNHTGSLEP